MILKSTRFRTGSQCIWSILARCGRTVKVMRSAVWDLLPFPFKYAAHHSGRAMRGNTRQNGGHFNKLFNVVNCAVANRVRMRADGLIDFTADYCDRHLRRHRFCTNVLALFIVRQMTKADRQRADVLHMPTYLYIPQL